MLELFSQRYGQHVEIGPAEEVLELWPPRPASMIERDRP